MKTILLTVALLASPLAHSAQPEVEMHRQQATTKDAASGWYLGKSTKGTFTALYPMPFNDFTMTAKDTNIGDVVTHIVGGSSKEGLKYTVTEMVRTERFKDISLKSFTEGFGGGEFKVSETDYTKYLDLPTVTFSASQDGSGAFFRYIITPKTVYSLILEYPAAPAAKVPGKAGMYPILGYARGQ